MEEIKQIEKIINDSQKILIIQADNPDADSIASALALESILHGMGKDPVMYCSVDMPNYLKYLPGWDRVSNEVPKDFDATIIVDTSALSLLEKLAESGDQGRVSSKPVIVLDHHAEVPCDIPYATVVINDATKVSTGALIFEISKKLNWKMPLESSSLIMTSILADSMGLTSSETTSDTYRVMAELVDAGVNRPKLEEERRAYNKMHVEIFRYKGRLIERTEIVDDKLALLVIPQNEINEYSPLYNPAPLIQGDHLQTEGILISVVLKSYDSGRITAAIRCNQGAPIASALAEKFGGGGHKFASGFKINKGNQDTTRTEVINKVRELLSEVN